MHSTRRAGRLRSFPRVSDVASDERVDCLRELLWELGRARTGAGPATAPSPARSPARRTRDREKAPRPPRVERFRVED